MKRFYRLLIVSTLAVLAAACTDDTLQSVADKVNQPLPQKIVAKMKAEGMSTQSPIMMRIFKEEGILEVWKQKDNGRYGKIAEYKICAWSGKLGPKTEEGDRQAPEGYYVITPGQMNPNSHYYLSFNIGYPNTYDKALGRTGSNIMVHGACSSAGCYSMSDENVAQIYAFARDAFQGGQRAFQIEAFPFRMTAENMAKHAGNPNYDFWKMLKVGYDYFAITKVPPAVNVCDRKYVFNKQVLDNSPFVATAACPAMTTPQPLQAAYAAYEKQYDQAYETALAKEQADAARAKEVADRKAKLAEARAEEKQRQVEREAASERMLAHVTAFLPSALQSATDEPGPTPAPAGNAPAAASASAAAAPAMPAGAAPAAAPVAGASTSVAPVPTPAPVMAGMAAPEAPTGQQADASSGKPFWKFWAK
ncbi:MAG: L,D-transpeptidase family protein [Pararhizobium sp.]